MTYLLFLILFVVLPSAGLTYLMRGKMRLRHYLFIAVNALLAVIYTTPWDNYLVATGVWFYKPELVLGITIGWVPIEEYTFFILQTLLTGTFFFLLWERFYPDDYDRELDLDLN